MLLWMLGAAGCAASRATSLPAESETSWIEAEGPGAAVRPASSAKAPALPFKLTAAHPEPELVTVRHRVARGETVFRIARTYGITVQELSSANGISDPRSLSVGQELLIPGAEAPESSRDEPEAPSGSKPSKPRVAAREEPPQRPPSRPAPRPGKGASRPVPATKGLLDWPLRGVLYGKFGKKGREPHDGIDLAAPSGTPVKTAQEGTVLYAGEQQGYGLIVIVQHSGGLVTLYAHNRDLRVKTGQAVRRSQVIATVGESGRTSGPHLHFEVRVEGKPVEPLDYLGPLPSA
ncbi:peptidoglycan DD-metalloendopeptidase family protein [Stigmatella hybrida]|uniref:peptidoglycan DD-metalloendopeptidase family protein n=1 Tax=Stigmatella hybrida TaxID=394097 RepID=UPI001CDAA527|nr:M23 family metallopeptidase [Stigmatella hybrida]